MPAELVRYDGDAPSLTETVADFAGALRPLLGMSRVVAKVMAARQHEGAVAVLEALGQPRPAGGPGAGGAPRTPGRRDRR